METKSKRAARVRGSSHFTALVALLVAAACESPTAPEPAVRVEISPRPDSLLVEDTVRLSAAVHGQAGPLADRRVSWSVSGTAATVDSTGLLRAIEPGEVTVTASVEERRDTVTVRVVSRQRLIIETPSSGVLLSKPSMPVSVRILGGPARWPERLAYRIASGPEVRAGFGCEPIDRCDLYVSGLPEGTSLVTITATFPSDTLQATIGVTVRTESLEYDVTFLGTLGEADSHPADLNERGEVVGRVFTGDHRRPFLYSDGRMTALPTTGEWSVAVAVNESGLVGGNDVRPPTPCWVQAVTWRDQVRNDPLSCGHWLYDISDTGAALLSGGDLRVVEGSKVTILNIPASPCYPSVSRARINGRGQVAAYVSYGSCKGLGVWLVENGNSTWLCPVRRKCNLGGMNEAGSVAVSGHTHYSDPHELFIWKDGSLTKLGSFNADTEARGINGNEEVVSMDRGLPVLWRAGKFYLIRAADTAWLVDDVVEINDRGQIVGHGRNGTTGEVGAILLDPKR